MNTVFINYAETDGDFARYVTKCLRKMRDLRGDGLDSWLDIEAILGARRPGRRSRRQSVKHRAVFSSSAVTGPRLIASGLSMRSRLWPSAPMLTSCGESVCSARRCRGSSRMCRPSLWDTRTAQSHSSRWSARERPWIFVASRGAQREVAAPDQTGSKVAVVRNT